MIADSAYHIGKTHFVCQDYALSGEKDGNPYAIVCDGCSGSRDTDIGARLLALAARAYLGWEDSPADRYTAIITMAKSWLHEISLGAGSLTEGALDATLLTLDVYKGMLRAGIYGDGVLVIKYKDAPELFVSEVVYPSGYPNYLNYKTNAIRMAGLGDRINGHVNTFCMTPAGRKDLSTVLIGNLPYNFEIAANEVSHVAVLSDGCESFVEFVQNETSKTEHPVPLVNVLNEMMAFKSFNGAFVQRRLQRFAKDCQAKNWAHLDDLSLAMIHLGN